MLNIVIPMAGRGSRFQKQGYTLPKPLISVHGKPMIELVINNLRPKCSHRFIFLCLQEHIDLYNIDEKLRKLVPDCEIVIVNQVTEGAACTVLLAKDYINNSDQLMIANSDQWVDIDINDYLEVMNQEGVDGLIMTMRADDPKWSFVRFDASGRVSEVVEKEVVSNEATVGIYNYRLGSDFVSSAESMIAKSLRVNNEFYVAPVYNEMIENGSNIAIYNIDKDDCSAMYGIGTPEDLKIFENLEVSKKAVNLSYAK